MGQLSSYCKLINEGTIFPGNCFDKRIEILPVRTSQQNTKMRKTTLHYFEIAENSEKLSLIFPASELEYI